MVLTLILAIFGLCLGSFVNALVYRVHMQSKNRPKTKNQKPKAKHSILSGRSQCPKCSHQLAAKDLIPVLSWLILRGKCRYCSKPISTQYPIVELAMVAVFMASYYLWPQEIAGGQWLLFLTWLIVSVGLLALAVYDWKWMILPNRILYPTFFIAVLGRLVYLLGYDPAKGRALAAWALSVAVASGFFWLISIASSGQWIGGGDIRLGWVLGTVLADPVLAFLMIFVASALGSLVAIPQLLSGSKKLGSKLPFGPFLIAATFMVLLFGDDVTSWYRNLL